MRYASVCDGIGAVHCAWQPLGWSCEWTAEIDAFPAAVVEQRWGFPNRGDMTRFKEWDDAPIDLLVGGTPCQSFSVAGLRKGLHDPRGGLMLTFLEIAQRYRPRWVVWENVPGVLSSNGGRDFGSFLGALGHLGYGWAYRVLDAQWFGVAQRRRRVFVVGCLGDERRAAQVLFESESVRRDNPPSRAKGQGVAAAAAGGLGTDGVDNAVCSKWSKGTGGPAGDECQNLVAFHPTQDPISSEGGLTHSLGCGSSRGCATVAVAFTKSKRAQSTSDDESLVLGEVSPTFNCFDQGDTRATTVVAFTTEQTPKFKDDCALTMTKQSPSGCRQPQCVMHPIAFTQNTRDEARQINGDGKLAGALSAEAGMHQTNYVAFAQNQLGEVRTNSDVMGTVNTNQNASGRNTPMVMTPAPVAFNSYQRTEQDVTWPLGASDGRKVEVGVRTAMSVRRLTPRECERLQGFPDDYTAIEYRKKPAADGPRYKALGNSMAVPVMRWLGERIDAVQRQADPA